MQFLTNNHQRPIRVLLSAYACEPSRGSEPGIGWNWMRQISRFANVWVITRESNRIAIEESLRREPIPNVNFFYFDLPRWARFWKKGGRGLQLYYYLWQVAIGPIVKNLHRSIEFDIVHHVTFGTCWFPSPLSSLHVPFVWGPVGGDEHAPWKFWWSYSWRGKIHEIVRTLGRARGDYDPLVRYTARRSTLALATTAQTERRLRAIGCKATEILPHAALDEDEISRLQSVPVRTSRRFRIFSIGRMLHWKGLHLGLRAFAGLQQRLPDSEYWIMGDGPEHGNLKKLARTLGVEQQVMFLGQVSRDQVLARIAECDVMLHPTLHDSSGWASVESMACGRPVVCLDLAGPALQVDPDNGCKVAVESPEQAIRDLTLALNFLASDTQARLSMGRAARAKVAAELNWSRKAERVREIYEGIISASRRTGMDTEEARFTTSTTDTKWA